MFLSRSLRQQMAYISFSYSTASVGYLHRFFSIWKEFAFSHDFQSYPKKIVIDLLDHSIYSELLKIASPITTNIAEVIYFIPTKYVTSEGIKI